MKNLSSFKKLAATTLFASTTIAIASLAAPLGAEAGVCRTRNNDKFIDQPHLAPNYSQSNYGGSNDCGPVAMAMQLKYINDKTTPGIWRGGDPNEIVRDLMIELPYDREYGTWDLSTIVATSSFWEDVKSVATSRTSNANRWGGDDDQWVWWSDLHSARRNNNPLDILILWPGTWMHGGGRNEYVDRHWMTGIGTRYKKRWGKVCGWLGCTGCWDYLAWDRKYAAVRTGWVQGGNSVSYINHALGDWYTIEIFDRAN
ncbi:hypothetical protein PMIT1342_02466 [Prochlorococcus marinus str. MIT 1342]|uniref:hypothetical protein n=1 Tax=Prochlorococcus TaxID=1218 RepID=UPI0007BC1171|nr:hypothetical protein [Prochlorococcus marinus]KZR80514.1 hypothetical protein PMIT1342_02466 [Prochlorococcus marinus str. MIT 1342]